MAKRPRTQNGVTVHQDRILAILSEHPEGLNKLEISTIVHGSTYAANGIAGALGLLRQINRVRVDYHHKFAKYYAKDLIL